MEAPLNSAALVILSQLQQHTKTLGEGFRGQLWDPRHTWAASCLDHLNGGVLFTAQRQHLSEIKLRGYCLKGQVRSKRQKMELFSGNWLIFAPHSSPSAAGGGKKSLNYHLKADRVSLGCSLEETIRIVGATSVRCRGGNWMRGKRKWQSDSTAEEGVLFLTGQAW